MKPVKLAVKITEQIRMPVIGYKAVLLTAEALSPPHTILTLRIPPRALFYGYSHTQPSRFADLMAWLISASRSNTCPGFI